jgi:hypothetical protein
MTRDDLRRALEPYGLEGGPCPSTEKVCALAAGRVAPEEAEALRSHLASCPACLEVWLEARPALVSEGGSAAGASGFSASSRPRREWALAAALAVALAGLGITAWKWTDLRGENRRLETAMARLRASPVPGRLVELAPDTFALRGEAEAVPILPAGSAAGLLLATLEPLPQGSVARIVGPGGEEVWRGPLPLVQGRPALLLVPAGLLPPGPGAVEVLDPAGGAVLLRFPFRVSDPPSD